MKNAFSIIIILLLTGCTSTGMSDELNEAPIVEDVTFESIAEYIDAIHAEWPDENKFFFQDGTADYSIEGYELMVDGNGNPVIFGNDQSAQYENAFFWIYAETGYESKVGSSASFYLRGMEGPRDAVYGPFEGNLIEMLR